MTSFEDVAVCDKCGEKLKIFSTDKLKLNVNGKGNCILYCICPKCMSGPDLKIEFNYDITSVKPGIEYGIPYSIY